MTDDEVEEYVTRLLALPYAFVLVADRELGGYAAEVLEFPNCFAHGETVEGAYGNLKSAAKAWIVTMLAMGRPIPLPLSEDGNLKVALRLSRDVYSKAAHLADRANVPLDEFITRALEAKLAQDPAPPASAPKVTVRDYGSFIIIGPDDN